MIFYRDPPYRNYEQTMTYMFSYSVGNTKELNMSKAQGDLHAKQHRRQPSRTPLHLIAFKGIVRNLGKLQMGGSLEVVAPSPAYESRRNGLYVWTSMSEGYILPWFI